jgi:hypothetical protein
VGRAANKWITSVLYSAKSTFPRYTPPAAVFSEKNRA